MNNFTVRTKIQRCYSTKMQNMSNAVTCISIFFQISLIHVLLSYRESELCFGVISYILYPIFYQKVKSWHPGQHFLVEYRDMTQSSVSLYGSNTPVLIMVCMSWMIGSVVIAITTSLRKG